MVRRILVALVLSCAVALATAPAVYAGQHQGEAEGIVAPSEYLEDIETPADSGGVMDEVDSAAAQAQAAEAEAKKKAAAAKAAAEAK